MWAIRVFVLDTPARFGSDTWAGGRGPPPTAACGRVDGTEEHGCRHRQPDFDDGQLPVCELGIRQGIGGRAGENRAMDIGRSGLGDVGIALADLPLAPGPTALFG